MFSICYGQIIDGTFDDTWSTDISSERVKLDACDSVTTAIARTSRFLSRDTDRDGKSTRDMGVSFVSRTAAFYATAPISAQHWRRGVFDIFLPSTGIPKRKNRKSSHSAMRPLSIESYTTPFGARRSAYCRARFFAAPLHPTFTNDLC